MATVTIRNLAPSVVQRIKDIAEQRGLSMEQEIRNCLETRYAAKPVIAERVRERWKTLPDTAAEDIEAWKNEGRA